MSKKITLGETQQAIAGRIRRSLKKPTAEERDYQHRWTMIELGKRCQQLEEENETLRDRIQALNLWDATSKLKISDLGEEVDALKQKLHEVEVKHSAQSNELLVQRMAVSHLKGVVDDIRAQSKQLLEEVGLFPGASRAEEEVALKEAIVAEKVSSQENFSQLATNSTFQVVEMDVMCEEIRLLRRDKNLAVEKVLKLEVECRRKDDINSLLTTENQEFSDKILGVNAQLGLLEHAYIDQWMAEKTVKALVGKKPKDVPLKDIKKLLDSVRKKIGEMEMELMAGINLSK